MPTAPVYSIQRDPPWIPNRTSTAPTTSSIYSDDSDTPYHEFAAIPMMPAELNIFKEPKAPTPKYTVSGFPHPKQQVTDQGPQFQRQSKLPIFKQVRGLLGKPLPPLVTPGKAGWDEFSGEPSESGKPRLGAKPSSYNSPYDLAFKNRGTARRPSPDKLRAKPSKRSISPVSTLRHSETYDESEQDIGSIAPLRVGPRGVSPVSPVTVSPISIKPPTRLSVDMGNRAPSSSEPSPSVQAIKRKPVSKTISTAENSAPPTTRTMRSNSLDSWERFNDDDATPVADLTNDRDPKSHFSWTTYATSQAPARMSTDTHATKLSQPVKEIDAPLRSRFSWSTVNTNNNMVGSPKMPQYTHEPIPQIPQQYHEIQYKVSDAPMQSILSRKRPVQRNEREEWSPVPHSAHVQKPIMNYDTPTQARVEQTLTPISTAWPKTGQASRNPATLLSATTSTSDKKLPLPPELQQPASPGEALSHLQALQAQMRDVVLQRRNIDKAIKDAEKTTKASPLDVSFANVRDAKKKLHDYESRLAEVLLEERELGVKISRARRKEGVEEGLWVRRVTG